MYGRCKGIKVTNMKNCVINVSFGYTPNPKWGPTVKAVWKREIWVVCHELLSTFKMNRSKNHIRI